MHDRHVPDALPLGAHLLQGGRCSFSVWAPRLRELTLELLPRDQGGAPRLVELERRGEIFAAIADDVLDGDRYQLVLPNGDRRPDPRSRRQPDGVHGPSAVVDLGGLGFDVARGERPPLHDLTIYELHVGTFTPEGTFDAVIPHLRWLAHELGVGAIEIMPVAAFPGGRNWGYDGVHLYAVQESYGGPAGLARLVRAAHEVGLAVILDVVYNHLGPEGNYLRDFGPYFTHKHETPWGEAVNFDDEGAQGVRNYVIDNAVQWVRDYHIDGLRLDAVHAIYDDSPRHVLAEVAAAVQAVGGFVIAESDLNDPVTVLGRPDGWGHDAQWSDDLHHALHALLTGERGGYYQDFGQVADVAVALECGFVYDGSRPSRFRGTHHGKSAHGVPGERHVIFLQNHDQVGNRAAGDRLAAKIGTEAQKVGAAAVLLAPGVPLLFMGEEWAASTPFPYFTSHGDPALVEAVRQGRKQEFVAFGWQDQVPDPQDEATFRSAVLRFEERDQPGHAEVLAWYQALLRLRRTHPALLGTERQTRVVVGFDEAAQVLWMERFAGSGERLLAILAFSSAEKKLDGRLPVGDWRLRLDSGGGRFGGKGGQAPATLEGGITTLPLPPSTAWIYEAG